MKSIKILPEIYSKIIPSWNVSVSDIQNFTLPKPAISKSPLPLSPPIFLSHHTPNITNVEEIVHLPTPSEALLKNLLKCPEIGQSQSFICKHLHDHRVELRVPLWTIRYWLEVLEIHSIKLLWASAQKNLDFLQQEHPLTNNIKNLITEVSSVLSKLSWKDKIKGFPVTTPPELLTSYLTQRWLSDEHETQMLHLLHKELTLRNPNSNIDIPDIFFYEILSELHREGTYDKSESAAWF